MGYTTIQHVFDPMYNRAIVYVHLPRPWIEAKNQRCMKRAADLRRRQVLWKEQAIAEGAVAPLLFPHRLHFFRQTPPSVTNTDAIFSTERTAISLIEPRLPRLGINPISNSQGAVTSKPRPRYLQFFWQCAPTNARDNLGVFSPLNTRRRRCITRGRSWRDLRFVEV